MKNDILLHDHVVDSHSSEKVLSTTREPQPNASVKVGVSIKSNTIVRTLAVVAVALIILNTIGVYLRFIGGYDSAWGLIPNFNLDTEGNVPSYFSALILMISGILFRIIKFHKKKTGDKYALHWVVLSFIFLYLSLDEATGIHDRLINPLRDTFNFTGIFYFSWVIVGGIAVIAFLVSYLKFFFALPTKYKVKFFLAAFIYIGGALGIELIGGYYSSLYGEENITYGLITTVEETMEITGVILLINALFNYIKEYIKQTSLIFK